MSKNELALYPSSGVAWGSVGVLSLTYMFSFMDRQILVLLIDPIKADLNITDTQVSLLTGLAFAVVYTVMSIPMGRLADNWVRKYVIIAGVTIWSLLTIASGFARNFLQLFLARMGVGFGEAGLTAPAYSMVADLFPANKLAFPMSVFVMGASIGGALSLLLGGIIVGFAEGIGTIDVPLLGELSPWRLVLIIAGMASLLVVVPLMFVPEPKRQPPANNSGNGEAASADKSAETKMSFSQVLGYLARKKFFYGPFVSASSVNYIIGYGAGVWLPTYFIRVMGWEASSIGVTMGLVSIVPLVLGGLIAGKLVDVFFSKGKKDAGLYLAIFSGPSLLLLLFLIIYIPQIEIKLAAMACYYFIGSMYSGVLPTVMQIVTPSPIRSQVSAIILFIMNMAGLGFGATAIALVTDYYFQNDMAVGDSIIIVAVIAFLLSTFLFCFTLKPFGRQIVEVGLVND